MLMLVIQWRNQLVSLMSLNCFDFGFEVIAIEDDIQDFYTDEQEKVEVFYSDENFKRIQYCRLLLQFYYFKGRTISKVHSEVCNGQIVKPNEEIIQLSMLTKNSFSYIHISCRMVSLLQH